MARRVVKDDMDDLLGWAVGFRRSVRGALWPYYPNNPMSGDEELLSTIRDLVALWKEQGKPTPAWKARVETYRERVKQVFEGEMFAVPKEQPHAHAHQPRRDDHVLRDLRPSREYAA